MILGGDKLTAAENNKYAGAAVARDMNTGEEEIDLVEIFYLMLDNIGKILICLLVGAILAFAGTRFLISPKYQATAKMYIVSASKSSVVDISDLNLSSALRADYRELLTNRPLLEKVIEQLDLRDEDGEPMSYRTLLDMVSVTNPTDTRIINITATTTDPQLSADIANAMANEGKLDLPRIMQTDEPSIYEPAIVPTRKSSPSYSRNTLIGGLLGALACMAVLIIRFLMNDTISTPDDVYKYFGVQPLAVIPEGNLGEFNDEYTRNKKSSKKKRREAED